MPVTAPATRRRRVAAVLRRVLWRALPTALLVVVFNFLLLQLAPATPPTCWPASPVRPPRPPWPRCARSFGPTSPCCNCLLGYLWGWHISTGLSPRYNMPVADMIPARLPNTLPADRRRADLGARVSVAAGTVMAARAGGWTDRLLSPSALLLYSVPGF